MPKIQKKPDEICFHCKHFSPWWKHEEVKEKGAMCLHFNKPFPEADAWVTDPDRKKPGERTCNYWEG